MDRKRDNFGQSERKMAAQPRNERGFENILIKHFEKNAVKKGREAVVLPTGGGDTELLADLIFGDSTRFGLIEMKDAKMLTASENLKSASNNLCRSLPDHRYMQQIHDSSHYIAWGRENTNQIGVGIYRNVVCKNDKENYYIHDEFIDKFLDGHDNIGSTREDFLSYVDWLLEVTGGSGIYSLILDNDETSRSGYIVISSIPKLIETLEQRPGPRFI